MNDSLARYLFLPWVRRGLATRNMEPSTYTTHRASLTVSLQINQKSSERIQKPVELYGPGDITGFSSRAVVRTDPKPNIGDFEPNYFPLIEFADADFPWRYTPLSVAEGQPRLQPWICLIVLRAEDAANAGKREFKPHVPAGNQRSGNQQSASARGQDPSKRLPPAIEVLDPKNSLPDLSQSWAWAHVQVTAGDDDPGSLQEIVRDEPERVVSRLLCPRRLAPGVLYHAFVVPTFESGRLAGLGEDLAAAEIDDPAWDGSQDKEVKLPYYFDWQFRTGLRGDFEYLVRLLEPRELDETYDVGQRDMDCADPGYELPGVERTGQPEGDPKRHVVALEGALKKVGAEPDPRLDAENGLGNFQDELTKLLNRPEEQLETGQERYLIVPPIYGRWHAAQRRLPGAEDRAWLDELNLDPRYRAIAGFGTLVVQDKQEELMAEAWRQIGAVNEANELLRQAQLGRAASERMHRRHLSRLPGADLIRLAGPVHARILIDDPKRNGQGGRITVRHLLQANGSRIPSAVLDPAFRRIARPRGPRRWRQRPDAVPDRPDILDRLNEGEVAAAGPLSSPDGAPGVGDVSEGQRPPWAKGLIWKLLKYLHWILLFLILVLYLAIALLAAFGISLSPTHPIVVAVGVLFALLSLIARRLITPGLVADGVREEEITPERVRSAPGRPDFVFEDIPGSDFSLGSTGGQDNDAARAFRQFASVVQGFLNPTNVQETEKLPIDLGQVRATLLDALDPRKTIPARMKGRLRIAGALRGQDGLEPIMAAPEFHQPMYEPLRDRSQELLLPGVGNIPQNTIAVLETNQRFIKAYMVGLNHEMARELLWREYPTDQRGSYFRQFWDVSRFVPPASMQSDLAKIAKQERADLWDMLSPKQKKAEMDPRLRENLKDIKPIHTWRDASLDGNSARQPDLQEKLVLLIRGDLLKKHPTTLIYAARAKWDDDKATRWPIFGQGEENKKDPVLGGTLPPDITFLGFALTGTEARGSPVPPDPSGEDEAGGSPVPADPNGDNLGWFFVIEERISETRFGMDAEPADPTQHSFDKWDDLSWADLPVSDGPEIEVPGLHPSGYVNIAMDPPAEPPAANNPEIHTWDSDAATIARITVQKPVRVAVHADDMLPEPSSEGQTAPS